MLKSILRLAGVSLNDVENDISPNDAVHTGESKEKGSKGINFDELERRTSMVQRMDVFTGEIVNQKQSPPPRQTLAKAKGDLTKK